MFSWRKTRHRAEPQLLTTIGQNKSRTESEFGAPYVIRICGAQGGPPLHPPPRIGTLLPGMGILSELQEFQTHQRSSTEVEIAMGSATWIFLSRGDSLQSRKRRPQRASTVPLEDS